MSDFTTINARYNSASTDAGATFTGNNISFGGVSGANELRFCSSGATGSTASANWPFVTRPASGTATVPQLWAFTADTTGTQIQTYDATTAHYAQIQWSWDNTGTFASAPQFSSFGDITHTAPVPGTQPGAQSGSPIVNGHATDTSSTSYLKINAYGLGGGAAPSTNAGGTCIATTGSGGALTTVATTWSGWQSAQGFIQYIVNGNTPSAVTAGQWSWVMILFTGAGMSTGTLQPVMTLQYSYT